MPVQSLYSKLYYSLSVQTCFKLGDRLREERTNKLVVKV